MKIIAITGQSKVGKSTVRDLLMDKLGPTKCHIIAFADPLKDEVCRMYGISRTYLEQHKDNFRLILQGHGTDYRRKLFSDTYWIEKYLKKVLATPMDYVLTDDCRFLNEYNTLVSLECTTLVKVQRQTTVTHTHVSETEQLQFPFHHYTIDNNGSLDELKKQVNDIYEKIK